MELREGASKRGRNQDRDSVNRSKRRRGSHSQSTEDSVGNEQDDDVLDAGVSKIRSPNNPTTTSFHADQNLRRIFTPARPPPFKITEEMIGATVPRKARSGSDKIQCSLFSFYHVHFHFHLSGDSLLLFFFSGFFGSIVCVSAASAKRSHESWVSASSGGGGGGGVEEMSFRQRSNSPGGQSVEPASPSSNISVRKKMVCARVFLIYFLYLFFCCCCWRIEF